jgi:hypothetical protein
LEWLCRSCIRRRNGRTSWLRRILMVEPIKNISASASVRPVLMPQSHFLSVLPRDWGIETTIAKDARVQIRNDIIEFIAMVQSQNCRANHHHVRPSQHHLSSFSRDPLSLLMRLSETN